MARGRKAMAAGLLAASLAACTSAPSDAPGWFSERDAAEAGTYPSLRDVPRSTIANTNAAHWSAVERDVTAAGEAMRANPRAEPATPDQDPAAFVDAARRDLEAARDAHPQ